MRSPSPTEPSGPESGHLLATLMVALMVMAILLGAAFQQWSVVMQRENEQELIFRGNQYVRAILLYRAEHDGALPLELEDLYRPGPRGMRYIRHLFPDPLDPGRGTEEGAEGWGLLYLGPGGKWIFDPQAAERAADRAASSGLDGLQNTPFGNAGLTAVSAGMGGQARQANLASLTPPAGGIGPGGPPALGPGGLPGIGGANPPLPGSGFTGGIPTRRDQTPQGVNLIVGVVSRNGRKSFSRYLQRDNYWDWQFHIFSIIRQFPAGLRPSSPIPTGGGFGPGGNLYAPTQSPDQQRSGGGPGYQGDFGTAPPDRPQGGSRPKNRR